MGDLDNHWLPVAVLQCIAQKISQDQVRPNWISPDEGGGATRHDNLIGAATLGRADPGGQPVDPLPGREAAGVALELARFQLVVLAKLFN